MEQFIDYDNCHEDSEEKAKRNRSVNWTEQEKEVLKMLIYERKDVIENKETSTNVNKAKKIAWAEVLKRFNTINSVERDVNQLQNQWRNMKNRAKLDSASQKDPLYITQDRPTQIKQVKNEQKRKIYNPAQLCCVVDHEHEIFLIQKKHREQIMEQEQLAHESKMRYEQEIHEKRMTIMSLEEEYWRKKLNQLDTSS